MTKTTEWPTVCATGHRPHKLSAGERGWLQQRIPDAVKWLRDERGMRVGVSGMADGVDLWFARAVVGAGLELRAVIPYESQPTKWLPGNRLEWHRLRETAGNPEPLYADPRSAEEAAQFLDERNRVMLRQSDAVLACWIRSRRGGTRNAVRDAQGRGLPGLHLDPSLRHVAPAFGVRCVEPGRWL
jgi:hypothetical protein